MQYELQRRRLLTKYHQKKRKKNEGNQGKGNLFITSCTRNIFKTRHRLFISDRRHIKVCEVTERCSLTFLIFCTKTRAHLGRTWTGGAPPFSRTDGEPSRQMYFMSHYVPKYNELFCSTLVYKMLLYFGWEWYYLVCLLTTYIQKGDGELDLRISFIFCLVSLGVISGNVYEWSTLKLMLHIVRWQSTVVIIIRYRELEAPVSLFPTRT